MRPPPSALLAAVALVAVSCGGATVQHVDLPPPVASASSAPSTEPLDELVCKPHGLVAIDPDPSGALDAIRLNQALLSARDFAQRCCNGDETGDATVRVTVSPDGYQTDVVVEPESLAGGATGACLYASFHRVIVKAYRGTSMTIPIAVHVR